MTLYDIIQHSTGDEAMMHKSLEHISQFMEDMKSQHKEIVEELLENQYELMNGRHINEWVARELVSKMWHKDLNGNVVKGEAITPEEAVVLIADKTADMQAKFKWDAYTAANAFAHDFGKSGVSMTKTDLLKLAKVFWFHDDDMGDEPNKVYWYFKRLIFE